MSNWTREIEPLTQLIQQVLHERPIDRDRIYLTGYSMGGYGAWALAIDDPNQFAAVVPIAGGGDPEQVGAISQNAVWALHGKRDRAVPITESEEMIEALRAAGGRPRFTSYPDAGHAIESRAYRLESGVIEWMFAQRGRDASAQRRLGEIPQAITPE